MARNRSSLVVLAVTLPFCTVSPTLAQPPAPTAPASDPAQKLPPERPNSLQEVADEIVWNPEQQGVLLLVAPRDTRPFSAWSRRVRRPDGTYATPQPLALPARGDEGLRVSQLEAYFDRQVVPCGDVTVLAPVIMTVLNYNNLPKPSASAGLKPADSFRLLQATLSEAQWRQLAAPQGLGLSDMTDNEQRDLFLASLPPRLAVQRYEEGHSENTPLGEAQRRGIRMYMVRQMSWMFQSPNGGFGIGREVNDSARLSIVNVDETDWEARQKQSYGKELMTQVPARAKPGDLPFNWEALDVPIRLDGIKTLGDIVGRIRDTTHVEVFADTRYESLPVFVRGDSARAGNLLKACARAVTGTYRKVGPAYVLTDDVAGLAVRHTLMYEWINANGYLASLVDKKVAKAFTTAKPYRFADYEEGDPLKPSDALLKRYQDYRDALRQPQKAGQPAPERNKQFATSDLPPKAQELIRKQVAEMQQGRHGDDWKGVTGESVTLSFSTNLKWNLPGIGLVEAPYGADVSNVSEDMPEPTAPKIDSRPLPLSLKHRVLVVGAGKADQIEKAITAAKRAGFTEIWVETNAQQPEGITGAVQAARQAHLGVRALVRAGRYKPAKGEGHTDIVTNPLGETYTEYLARALASGIVPRSPWDYSNRSTDGPNPALLDMERQRDRGDWLDPESPRYVKIVEDSVAAVAKIPGLTGIIVSDIVPPGYRATTPTSYDLNPMQLGTQGGYSEAHRLAFLRRFHVDPIDLSTIGSSGFNRQPYYLRFRENNYLQFSLPFFPDDGPSNQPAGDGSQRTASGTGKAFQQWNRFRSDAVDRALTSLQKTFASSAVPVWYYQNTPPGIDGLGFFVENRDKAPSDTETLAAPSVPGPEYNPFAATAAQRSRSSVLLMALDMAPFTGSSPFPGVDMFLLMTGYLFDPKSTPLKNWDGMVLDMTGETLPQVTAHITGMPLPTAAPPSTNATRAPGKTGPRTSP